MHIRAVSAKYPLEQALDKSLFWPNLDTHDNISHSFDAEALMNKGYLFVVTTSSGPLPAGLNACMLGVETLVKEFYQKTTFIDVQTQLQEALQTANKIVYDYIHLNFDKPIMGNSIVAAVVKGEQICIANVGDTAAYLVKEQHIKELVPIEHPPMSENLYSFVPLIGTSRDNLPIRAKSSDPVSIPPLYIDTVSQIEIKEGDILILTSRSEARPDWLGEQLILDLVKNARDKTLALEIAKAATDWTNSKVAISITVIQFS